MKRFLLSLIVLMLFAMPSSASVHISVSPSAIWLGDNTTITCFTDNASEGLLHSRITSPISATLSGFNRINESYFTYSYIPPIPGEYRIYCTNSSSVSNETSFAVANLTLDADSFPKTIYLNDEMTLTANLYMETNTTKAIKTDVDFSVFIDSEKLDIKGVPYYYENHWIINTEPLTSFEQGNHTINIYATYKGKTVGFQDTITVLPDLDLRLISLSSTSTTGQNNITADLSLTYRGTYVLQESQITASLDDQPIKSYKTQSGIIISLPDKQAGRHTLKITAVYNSMSAVKSVDINYLLSVSGSLEDSDSKPLSGKMIFDSGDQRYIIEIKNGQYSAAVPKGKYIVTLSIKNIEATFSGVDISSSMNDIMSFDFFPDSKPPGVRAVSGFAMDFLPDFDIVTIKAIYDASAIDDETTLKVFYCDGWNIDSRKCYGKWKTIDPIIDASRNTVEFSLHSLSGFVIGKEEELEMQSSTDKNTYHPGDKIKLTGVVKSGTRPVSDAIITYTGNNITGETKTNSNGVFSANINCPTKEGTYTMIVTATKGLYIQATNSIEFSVEAKKDISLIVPLSADALLNSSSSFDITVVNTGQATLHDIFISISGIPEEWFTFEPKTWESIKPGEEKTVHLIILPLKYEKKSYIIDVTAESDEINKTESFILNMHSIQNTSNSAPITQSENISTQDSFEALTSYVTANSETLVNNGSLIASAIIIFYIFWKLWGKRDMPENSRYAPKHTIRVSGNNSFIHDSSNITQIVKREVLRNVSKTTGKRKSKKNSRKRTHSKSKRNKKHSAFRKKKPKRRKR